MPASTNSGRQLGPSTCCEKIAKAANTSRVDRVACSADTCPIGTSLRRFCFVLAAHSHIIAVSIICTDLGQQPHWGLQWAVLQLMVHCGTTGEVSIPNTQHRNFSAA